MTFEEFVASRLQALLRYAAVLTGDRDEARDLVQTVLAKVFASWGRVARADRPEAYVHRMLTNEFLNSRRGRRPTVRRLPEQQATVIAMAGVVGQGPAFLIGDQARDRITDDEVGRMLTGLTAAPDEDDQARWLPLRLP